jgi:hypothetical protein
MVVDLCSKCKKKLAVIGDLCQFCHEDNNMKIKTILQELADEPGSKAKMEILKRHKDNELLQKVLYLALSRRVKFYIKEIPSFAYTCKDLPLSQVLEGLDVLSRRVVTGHDAIDHLSEMLSDLHPDDAYVLERVIEKDLKIGMGTTLTNKIFPKLIEETPYMGAKSYDEKYVRDILKDGSALSQLKMDGRYANAIIRDGSVELESRQGEITHLEGSTLVKELEKFPDCVLNGELTIGGMNRYKANGIVASLVSIGDKIHRGENVTKEISEFEKKNSIGYQEALNRIHYTVWDRITVEQYFDAQSKVPYSTRLAQLNLIIVELEPTRISLVEGEYVSTVEEVMMHFQKMLKEGEEGTILKALNKGWKDGKPTYQIKVKLEMTFDLRIVGFQYGTPGTKNEKVISTLLCESEDGLLKTNPSGMTESMMEIITKNQDKLLGTVVECESSGISQNKDGEYSMLHPRVLKLRDDKSTCDTLESIKEIEAMAKGLK